MLQYFHIIRTYYSSDIDIVLFSLSVSLSLSLSLSLSPFLSLSLSLFLSLSLSLSTEKLQATSHKEPRRRSKHRQWNKQRQNDRDILDTGQWSPLGSSPSPSSQCYWDIRCNSASAVYPACYLLVPDVSIHLFTVHTQGYLGH